MIQSMTGFGRASVSSAEHTVQAELSSLNNRFLEVGLKLPRQLMPYQHAIREMLKKRVKRGKLTLFMSVSKTGETLQRVELDEAVAAGYVEAARRLSASHGVADNLGARELLSLDGVLASTDSGGENPELWEAAEQALDQAIVAFHAARAEEGRTLHADMASRLDRIDGLFAQVEEAWKESRPQRRQQLDERLSRLLEGLEMKPERFEMEIAVLLDKQDISEEITRFRSHSELFRQTMGSGETAGSKLGFVLQEMVREANTVSSKSPDTTLTHLVVEIKEEVERIREQVQNVE